MWLDEQEANKLNRNPTYVKSSGNIFADLNIENPEEELAKAQLAYHVRRIIEERQLTPVAAGQILDTPASQVADLVGGKVSAFTYDHLLHFLSALECDVQIVAKPRGQAQGQGRIQVAAS